MDRLQYARRYQNSTVRECQKPSSVCQCHDIIMSLSVGVLCFTGQIDTQAHPHVVLCRPKTFCCMPSTSTRNRSQKRNRQNVTMSLANSEWRRHRQCHAATYVLRRQTPKTRRTSCERRRQRRSTHQAF